MLHRFFFLLVRVAFALRSKWGNVRLFPALSCQVAIKGSDISLSSLPEFVAKTESRRNPLSRSFLMSLVEFVGDLSVKGLLWLVGVVGIYLDTPASLAPCPRSLLVSPRCPSRSL